MEIKRLTIDRAKWGIGWLRNYNTGKMCCLGFLGRACGVPSEILKGKGMPSDLSDVYNSCYPEAFKGGKSDVTKAVELAAKVNDSECISWPEKEYRLKILFRAHGIRLTFKGKRSK